MGVYIANMAKPSCCERCILQDGEMCFAIDDGGDGLSLFSLEDLRDFCIKRRDDCPLEEIDLVRCGECVWYEKPYCRWHNIDNKPTDFCSYAERRE